MCPLVSLARSAVKVPKYRKHSSRNLGFAQFGGHRHYFPGVFESAESTAAYRLFLAEKVFANTPNGTMPGYDICVAELCVAFLDYAATYYPQTDKRSSSEYSNCALALKRFAQAHGSIIAKRYGPLKLEEWQQSLASQGLARSYVNKQIGIIKRMFRWGVSKQMIPSSVYESVRTTPPVKKGRTAAREGKNVQAVSWAHVQPILDDLPSVVKAMVLVQWHTGMRGDSIFHAKPSQFTREGDLLLWRPKHKTQNKEIELIVPIGPRCQEVLAPYLTRPADKPMFAPSDARKNGRYHERYSANTYRQAIHRAIERYNLQLARFAKQLNVPADPVPVWSPHQLRHAKGGLVRGEYGLEAAQATLGHATVQAAQLYTHRQLELAKKVARETG